LLTAFAGNAPSRQDKQYWKNISNPIKVYDTLYVFRKKTEISIATFIGRFYRRY
jgi:hypothetical protein